MIHKLESFMRIDTVVSRNTMMYLTKSHILFDLLSDFWSVSKNQGQWTVTSIKGLFHAVLC